jgi:prophage regulatory protein
MRKKGHAQMKIVRKADAAAKLGISGRHLDRLESEGRAPRRIQLGRNSVGWIESELDEWIEARAAERYQAA